MGLEGTGSISIAIVSSLILGFAFWIIHKMANL